MSESDPKPNPSEKLPEEKLFQRDLFDLLYTFAKKISEKTGIPIEKTLYSHTPLYRRFGCKRADPETHPIWQNYLQGLDANQADPVTYTYEFYKKSAVEQASRPKEPGSFSFDPPDQDGVVRIHFTNDEMQGVGPLSDERMPARMEELKRMFTHIRVTYPNAKTVRGGSWLYHLETYRRLFPASYGDSRKVIEGAGRLQGFSRWGQFLDRNRNIRPDVVKQFFDNLDRVDAEHIIDAFPIPSYRAEASIQDFYDFYGITDGRNGVRKKR